MDEKDAKNVVCRFNKALLRESIYQILLYKSCKKDLHTATEKHLLTKPLPRMNPDSQHHINILRYHMLLAQDVLQESQLLLERRKALVVMEIQN